MAGRKIASATLVAQQAAQQATAAAAVAAAIESTEAVSNAEGAFSMAI